MEKDNKHMDITLFTYKDKIKDYSTLIISEVPMLWTSLSNKRTKSTTSHLK
jgi:hypothetical protein